MKKVLIPRGADFGGFGGMYGFGALLSGPFRDMSIIPGTSADVLFCAGVRTVDFVAGIWGVVQDEERARCVPGNEDWRHLMRLLSLEVDICIVLNKPKEGVAERSLVRTSARNCRRG